MQSVWEKLWGKSNQLCSTATVKVNQTERGIFFDGSAQSKTPSAPPSNLAQYQIRGPLSQHMGNFWFIAFKLPLDPTIAESNPLIIAKPPELMAIKQEVLDGETFNYDYSPWLNSENQFVKRTSTSVNSGFSETQVVVPRYRQYSIIWAMTVPNVYVIDESGNADNQPSGTVLIDTVIGTPVTLLDINSDGRAWCATLDNT